VTGSRGGAAPHAGEGGQAANQPAAGAGGCGRGSLPFCSG
jgi:hypothetical protein